MRPRVKWLHCKYCGARLRRDAVGQYCPSRNCQWSHGLPAQDDAPSKQYALHFAAEVVMIEDMPNTCLLNWKLIKPRREALGLTQEKAAEAAGFNTRQRWNAIESGRKPDINLETLGHLARSLQMTPAELLVASAQAKPRKRRQLAKA